MNESQISLSIAKVLTFQSLIAGIIDVNVLKVEVEERIHLYGKISIESALSVFKTGTFHVDESDEPMGWESGLPIDIVLRMRNPIAERFSNIEKLTAALLTDETSPLRHTESWLLLEAMQKTEVPGAPGSYASFGVRTDWADPIP